LDLVIGIPALLIGIAEVPDGGARARGSVLVLGADPGEVDGLARPGDGDDLAEAPLRPFRWIVALDVQALRQRRVSGDGCSHDDGECGPRRVGKGAERAVPTRIHAGHSLSSAAARWFDDHHLRAWARRTLSRWDRPSKLAWARAFAHPQFHRSIAMAIGALMRSPFDWLGFTFARRRPPAYRVEDARKRTYA